MRVCGRSTDDGRDDMLAQYDAAVSVRGTVLVAPDVLWSPLGTRTRRRGRPHIVLSSSLVYSRLDSKYHCESDGN